MAEYRIIKRAGLYVVQRKMATEWREHSSAGGPHDDLKTARWWMSMKMARDESQPFEVIE